MNRIPLADNAFEPSEFTILHVLMRTGKHAGQVVQVADHPHVVLREGARITITLPGLEGSGVLVPSPNSKEN